MGYKVTLSEKEYRSIVEELSLLKRIVREMILPNKLSESDINMINKYKKTPITISLSRDTKNYLNEIIKKEMSSELGPNTSYEVSTSLWVEMNPDEKYSTEDDSEYYDDDEFPF